MNNSSTITGLTAGSIFLTQTLLATAIVIQQAFSVRAEMTEDQLPTPVWEWVHPLATAALILGYVLSLAALGAGVGSLIRTKKER